jgi:eukaryotic-like serine/threonine-protein kinase
LWFRSRSFFNLHFLFLILRSLFSMSATLSPTAETSQTRNKSAARSCGTTRQWELTELVGQGSLAEVYRARPVGSPANQPAAYALKMLRPCWQDDAVAIELLQREALAAQSVVNPHVISILTAFVGESPRLLVMPWLEGASIRDRLKTGQKFSVHKTLWVARQTAEALVALHAAGWTHGDVTPANIHVSPVGHVTLLDLSFARRSDEIGSAADRPILGTCSYIAPEFLVSALRPDIRSDLFSLGAVLFEMLCGQTPYRGRSLAELAIEYQQSPPRDLAKLTPETPREIIQLVKQMIAHDPIRRPSSPQELLDRLIPLEIAAMPQWSA